MSKKVWSPFKGSTVSTSRTKAVGTMKAKAALKRIEEQLAKRKAHITSFTEPEIVKSRRIGNENKHWRLRAGKLMDELMGKKAQ